MSLERLFVFDTNGITSGDKDLLVLAETFPVSILTPAQFLIEKQVA